MASGAIPGPATPATPTWHSWSRICAALSARGVRFKSAPVEVTHGRNVGAKAVYLLDPDDVTLELIQPAKRS